MLAAGDTAEIIILKPIYEDAFATGHLSPFPETKDMPIDDPVTDEFNFIVESQEDDRDGTYSEEKRGWEMDLIRSGDDRLESTSAATWTENPNPKWNASENRIPGECKYPLILKGFILKTSKNFVFHLSKTG